MVDSPNASGTRCSLLVNAALLENILPRHSSQYLPLVKARAAIVDSLDSSTGCLGRPLLGVSNSGVIGNRLDGSIGELVFETQARAVDRDTVERALDQTRGFGTVGLRMVEPGPLDRSCLVRDHRGRLRSVSSRLASECRYKGSNSTINPWLVG